MATPNPNPAEQLGAAVYRIDGHHPDGLAADDLGAVHCIGRYGDDIERPQNGLLLGMNA